MKATFLLHLLLATIFLSFAVKSIEASMLIFVCVALYFFKILWLNPWEIRKKLRAQGIKGPKSSLWFGNVWEMKKLQEAASSAIENNANYNNEFVAHDYTSTLFPYFEHWRKQYGPVFTYSTGKKQHLYVNQPDLVKEMSHCISSDFGKPCYITKRLAPILGNGILRSNGHFWKHQRNIVAPEFFMDKVKGMVGFMLESTHSLTTKWEAYIQQYSQAGQMVEIIKVEDDLRTLSADVISKACFGSSFLKGKLIFSKLRTLQKAISDQTFLFGSHAFGLLPTREKKKIEELEKEIERLIWETVKERGRGWEEEEENKDLLQFIVEGGVNDKRFIVDNCKNIYFAGHESTAVAASWCLMLLALHPQWQARIRAEISHSNAPLNPHSLLNLKTVTMVIQEVLRLYPPGAFVSREALQEIQIGHIVVPKGTCLWTLIPTLHRDTDIWGLDANEFNPDRFANGISNACKLPQAYIPFGLGPRLCLGRNFALVELKIVIAIIVSKFTFTLSPNYTHSPAYRMIVEPGQGLHLLIQRYSK